MRTSPCRRCCRMRLDLSTASYRRFLSRRRTAVSDTAAIVEANSLFILCLSSSSCSPELRMAALRQKRSVGASGYFRGRYPCPRVPGPTVPQACASAEREGRRSVEAAAAYAVVTACGSHCQLCREIAYPMDVREDRGVCRTPSQLLLRPLAGRRVVHRHHLPQDAEMTVCLLEGYAGDRHFHPAGDHLRYLSERHALRRHRDTARLRPLLRRRYPSRISLQLAAAPMRVFPVGVNTPSDHPWREVPPCPRLLVVEEYYPGGNI
jgi:hypothetical protein